MFAFLSSQVILIHKEENELNGTELNSADFIYLKEKMQLAYLKK